MSKYNTSKLNSRTYQIKRQQFGGFKIVEYRTTENKFRKRTLYKGLNLSQAEEILYRLER